ncbi:MULTISPECIES: DUF443 family protein [Allobacillus]|nr:DUF443 family protein [Allobacillus salarius]
MKCTVQGVYMNLRYRIVTIDEKDYIVDLGDSIWKILFPFLYWMLPNTAYQVNHYELIEKIKAPKVKQKSTTREGLLAGLMGVLLASFLQPLMRFFDIEGTTLINSSIVLISFLLVIFVYFYINQKNRKSLLQTVNLKNYSTIRVWIRPQSFKYMLFILLTYLFFFGFTLLMWGGFIQVAANVLILIFGMLFLFIALFTGLLAIGVGDYNVKIKSDEKVAV